MTRIAFAFAVVCSALLLVATPVSADEPATTAKPALTAPGTVVVTGTTDVMTATPARRGIFARLRARRGTSTAVTMPLPATTTMPDKTIPSPMPKPITVTPAGGITTATPMTTSTVMAEPMARRGIFSRLRNRGATTAPVIVEAPMPMSEVKPTSGTTMVEMPMTTSPVKASSRRGILARLRAR